MTTLAKRRMGVRRWPERDKFVIRNAYGTVSSQITSFILGQSWNVVGMLAARN